MAYNPQARITVLQHLEKVGVLYCASGRATEKLRVACGYQGSSLGTLLAVLQREGLIEREIKGRRCYRIRLAGAPQERTPIEPEDVQEVAEAAVVQPPPVPDVDYDHLALELVAKFVEQLTPHIADPELQRRLARLHEHARSLESKIATLTRERDDARDAYKAARVEVTGVRERLRLAEENIERLKRAPLAGGFVTADEAIDHMMRERPYVGANNGS